MSKRGHGVGEEPIYNWALKSTIDNRSVYPLLFDTRAKAEKAKREAKTPFWRVIRLACYEVKR